MKALQRLCIFIFFIDAIAAEVADRFYPRYHLGAPKGSLISPSGFCEYNKEFHVFYEYNPNNSLGVGSPSCGHSKSSDLFHWEEYPIAVSPSESHDKDGILSGSALVDDGKIYLYYTGNVGSSSVLKSKSTQVQRQALAISKDGTNFTKYQKNPIIEGEKYQPVFRHPNVWKNRKTYYMVVGNSYVNGTTTRGRVLLYTSPDKLNWTQASVLAESNGTFGSVWEYPDFFEIKRNTFVLLFTAKGVKKVGENYKNDVQCGYIVGNFDYKTNVFEPITEFVELDRGHDLIAARTIEDRRGRRILIAYLDMDGKKYPEQADGWYGLISLPRELSISRNDIIQQKPVREISKLKSDTIYSGNNRNHEAVRLPNKAGEVIIEAKTKKNLRVYIESDSLLDRVTINYNSNTSTISFKRGGLDGERTAIFRPRGNSYTWRIYLDGSSIEMFCEDGELTFSSRYFPKGDVLVRIPLSLTSLFNVKTLTVNALERTVPPVNPKQIPSY